MDSRSGISNFLTSRRAKLTPEKAGVPLYSGARRVPGLRREEVAHLAGVSADYYARLERGKISGASREVIEAIARALQLDEDERDHLIDLARMTLRRAPRRKPSNRTTVRAGIQSVLASIDAPAFVQNARLDRLASNKIGRALYSLPDDGSRDRFNYGSGQKMLTHSAVGDLEFGYESFELSTDPGLVMLVYTVEPGSTTADAMRILASWTAPALHST